MAEYFPDAPTDDHLSESQARVINETREMLLHFQFEQLNARAVGCSSEGDDLILRLPRKSGDVVIYLSASSSDDKRVPVILCIAVNGADLLRIHLNADEAVNALSGFMNGEFRLRAWKWRKLAIKTQALDSEGEVLESYGAIWATALIKLLRVEPQLIDIAYV